KMNSISSTAVGCMLARDCRRSRKRVVIWVAGSLTIPNTSCCTARGYASRSNRGVLAIAVFRGPSMNGNDSTEVLAGRVSAPRHLAIDSATGRFATIATVFLLGILAAPFYAVETRNGPATLIELAFGALSCLIILFGSRNDRSGFPLRAWMAT